MIDRFGNRTAHPTLKIPENSRIRLLGGYRPGSRQATVIHVLRHLDHRPARRLTGSTASFSSGMLFQSPRRRTHESCRLKAPANTRVTPAPHWTTGPAWEYGGGKPKFLEGLPLLYGDAGGMAAGENPTISVVELYVTPFDEWGEDAGETRFSHFPAHPHQIVEFFC